jgi:hypothetical protein
MTFTLSFIFIVCGLVFYVLGHFTMSQAKTQMKHADILIIEICKEHVALLQTYRDMLKYAKNVGDPYSIVYGKKQSTPTIQ